MPCQGTIHHVSSQDITIFSNQDNNRLPFFIHDLMCIYEQASSWTSRLRPFFLCNPCNPCTVKKHAGHQLEASRKQHKFLCKRWKAKKVILHTILLGVGGSIYTARTIDHLKELGLDAQKAYKAALKFHAHSVLYAHKLTTTRRALEKSSCSLSRSCSGAGGGLLPSRSSLILPFPWWRRLTALRANVSPFPSLM